MMNLASIFSGNKLPKSAETIAQNMQAVVWTFYNIGRWTCVNIYLGEHLTKNNKRFNLVKGSGKTYTQRRLIVITLDPIFREYNDEGCIAWGASNYKKFSSCRNRRSQ